MDGATLFWNNAFANAVGSLLGGGVLALLALFASDFVFRLPNLNGFWTLEVTTRETSYKPFNGLKTIFLVALSQDGSKLRGSGEKVFETRGDGTQHEYIGTKRTRLSLDGAIRRRFFAPCEIVIHVVEHAHLRETSSIYELATEKRQKQLIGKFISTAANSRGEAVWRRGLGKYNFEWPPPA